MIERLMLALCTTVVFSTPASADQFRVYGQGTKSCEKLLTEYQQNLHSPDSLEKLPFSADTVWVAGYLTAFNQYSSTYTASVLASTDIDGTMHWIVNYCAQHPGDTVEVAFVEQLVSTLSSHDGSVRTVSLHHELGSAPDVGSLIKASSSKRRAPVLASCPTSA